MERTVGRRVLQARADWQNRLQDASSRGGRVRGFALRSAARRVGGYNVQAADAARRTQVAKEINDQSNAGRDDEIRGLTVDRAWADAHGVDGVDVRTRDGVRQYRTLGGGWVSEGAVVEGHRRWGNDTYAQQSALSYEMRKATSEEQTQRVSQHFGHTARSWGMTENQGAGTWIGAAFENQNQHLEYKYTNWDGGSAAMDYPTGQGMVDEIYEKRGSYPLAQMGSNTIEQLKNIHAQAAIAGDQDTMNKISAISQTFMSELQQGAVPAGAAGAPVPVGAAAGTGRQAHTPGAAHVAERVRELATQTGVYGAAPTGLHVDQLSGAPHAPTPNRREQT